MDRQAASIGRAPLKSMFKVILISLLVMLGTLPMEGNANHHNANYKKGKKAQHGGLPPGLQKKADRGQPLPPGWQKKISQGAILEVDLFHRAHIIDPVEAVGILTLRLEDKILKVHEKTRKIIEILR